MGSSLTPPLIGATSSVGAAASGAPSWIIILLAAAGLLPSLLRECRSWRADRHSRTRLRWAEDRILRTEAMQLELHRCIADEISQLPDGSGRIEQYMRLLDKTQRDIPIESRPEPGEGAANSP